MKMMNTEKATFGAGCFWHIEDEFSKLKGVISTQVGYIGGTTPDPTYKNVCSGQTGHAEAVQIVFNPKIMDYSSLLNFFWEIHDPTQLNRQGPDIGHQYRSVIFTHSKEQEKLAVQSMEKFKKSGKYKNDIVTEIQTAKTFYKAEEYHQKYIQKINNSYLSKLIGI